MKTVYKPLGITSGCLFVISVISALVAIWTHDGRWALTALVVVVVALVLGLSAWLNFIWMRYFIHDNYNRP